VQILDSRKEFMFMTGRWLTRSLFNFSCRPCLVSWHLLSD